MKLALLLLLIPVLFLAQQAVFPTLGTTGSNAGGGGPPTLVSVFVGQDISGSNVASINSTANNVVAGNMVVCAVRTFTSTRTVTVTDTGSANTFNLLQARTLAGTAYFALYVSNITTPVTGDVITLTPSASDKDQAIACEQWSGTNTIDGGAHAGFIDTATTATNLQMNTGTFITVNNVEVAFWAGTSNTFSGQQFTLGAIGTAAADGITCSDSGNTCLSANSPILAIEHRVTSAPISTTTSAIITLGTSSTRMGNTAAISP